MKACLLGLLISIISISLSAQSNDSKVFGKVIVKYRTMEKAGAAMTIAGGAALFTGNFLYWKAYNHRDIEEPSSSKVNGPRNLMLGGLGLIAAGIPLWSVGKANERHITIEATMVRFREYASVNGAGIRITF